jgi:hypothetical protein
MYMALITKYPAKDQKTLDFVIQEYGTLDAYRKFFEDNGRLYGLTDFLPIVPLLVENPVPYFNATNIADQQFLKQTLQGGILAEEYSGNPMLTL